MTTLVLVVVNGVLIAAVVGQLVGLGRRERATALPYWPESLELPIPGLTRAVGQPRRSAG